MNSSQGESMLHVTYGKVKWLPQVGSRRCLSDFSNISPHLPRGILAVLFRWKTSWWAPSLPGLGSGAGYFRTFQKSAFRDYKSLKEGMRKGSGPGLPFCLRTHRTPRGELGRGASCSENLGGTIGAAAIVRDRNHWAQVWYSFRNGGMAPVALSTRCLRG